jgi:hypothetical protein
VYLRPQFIHFIYIHIGYFYIYLLYIIQAGTSMSYLSPKDFVTKMVDSGESKVYMSIKDTLIRYIGKRTPFSIL